MNIHRVSDGAFELSALHISNFHTLADLRQAVSEILDIPEGSLILFLGTGKALDDAAFHTLWENAGPHDNQARSRESLRSRSRERNARQAEEGAEGGIYAFDREAFAAEPEEFVKGLEEEVVLEQELPSRPLYSAHLSNQTLAPFLAHLNSLHSLTDRLAVQLRGLGIAGENLEEHLGKLVDGHADDAEGDKSSPTDGPSSPSGAAQSATSGWRAFQHLIETELSRELGLIGPYASVHPPPTPQQQSQPEQATWGMEQDMHVISSIEVHESFRPRPFAAAVGTARPKDVASNSPGPAAMTRNASGSSPTSVTNANVSSPDSRVGASSSREEKRKTLVDYVNYGRMKVVRDNCRKIYGEFSYSAQSTPRFTHSASLFVDDHQTQYAAITNDLFTFQSSTEQILRSIDGLSPQVEQEMAFLLGEAEAVVDEARMLVVEDPDVHWQSLRALDATMRELVVSMTNLKLHIHLHSISIQQSSIAHISSTMSSLELALLATRTGALSSSSGKTSGFTHLDRLRNMLSAYLITSLEILWRQSLSQVLEAKTSGFTESLAGFLTVERKRRRVFEQAELTLLPPDINVFARHVAGAASPAPEGGTPDFEFSVRGGFEELQGRHITRTDLEVLVSTVDALKQDPALVPYLSSSPDGVLDRAIDKLKNLMDDMDLSILQLETLWADKRRFNKKGSRSLSHTDSLGFAASIPSFTSSNQQQSDEMARLTQEYAAMQSSHERLRRQVQDMERSPYSAAEQNGLAEENEALRQQIAQLQVDLHHRQNLHEQDLARMQQLEADRSQILQGLSDARNDEENLAARLVGLQAELDSVLSALAQTQSERDQLADDQVHLVENAVEARLEELQGDRLQLQEQSAALLVEIEQVKSTQHSHLENLENRHGREVDGLKAELGMARAQAKESQKGKVDLLQDLSANKTDLAAVRDELASASKFNMAAIKLASKYHDCVARLHAAIQSSATISGSTPALLRVQDPVDAVANREPDGQSLLQQELDLLQEYDLDGFTDAVNRTMSLVKKWQKSCRSYRDRAKDKLAFSNFGRGDLALFLPTRNATAKSWAAFNISSPHHFLRVASHPTLEEQVKNREWIVARITKIDEDVVETTQRPDSNPYGLAEGIRYYSLSVEPYTPSSIAKLRRSDSGNKMPAMSTPGALLTSRTLSTGQGTDYFGSMTMNKRTAPLPETTVPTPREAEPRVVFAQPRRPSSVASSQGSTFSKKGKGFHYGTATKAPSTLAVSSRTSTGLDRHTGGALPLETQQRTTTQRRSFSSTLSPADPSPPDPFESPAAALQRPTLHPQLRPGSFSRRVATNTADTDNTTGMGQGALDILKRIESERNAKK
ncbi:hypothetical protein QFC21_006900 [Naganishia friedmannii]|uniref:Uncharacterized protein n=1 Tax=Naganishia friedmannii TaxID=89922 RepID=A0ACC2UYW0_9TREE|nr:hypothetical protein QFC21_006900 [Naganishia friedmannii]